MLRQFYAGKRVLVTGHTGFKGSWLSLWLRNLGAKVGGLALAPSPEPNLYSLVRGAAIDFEVIGDIRDLELLRRTISDFKPDLIFHLAAQPLVRKSYAEPLETFTINTVGTVNLLEAVRVLKLPTALVLITTDKCYENREWDYSYRENDALGGADPYSASKAAAEIVIHSYRTSFFQTDPALGPVASARAGNVIGGGDYAEDRIVPDAVRALLAGKELIVRNPGATRPWQHVLDCLHGYLNLGQQLVECGKNSAVASAFNFGPGPHSYFPVSRVVEEIFRLIPGGYNAPPQEKAPHEAGKLNLAIDKAGTVLGWTPRWPFEQAIRKTVEWYEQRHFKKNVDMAEFSLKQIHDFEN
ncbi:MAG TPA: CDP-glucose 4,6-dehydratase, partial [Candidatus Kapabacteria bacterium]|nr:CDP-glucose 4,6-dehydratase [Candidatus Kapabacteria bacterium]